MIAMGARNPNESTGRNAHTKLSTRRNPSPGPRGVRSAAPSTDRRSLEGEIDGGAFSQLICNKRRPRPKPGAVTAPRGWSERFLCVSSMKVEGSSSHGRLLVAGRGSGRGPGGGRVDQSSIRAGSPMVSCGWGGSIKLAAVAQQGHDTHRARPDHAAGYRVLTG